MSSIEKLSIRGIRSFSPEESSVIEFYTPLTIIVGHNGAGKTTIIECLKYATTGDLPPNSKGGAFIHDLKLTNDCEIKAQIKLKFKSVSQQSMVVTRSIQVTQKKTKLEQKTLESLLSTKDPQTGEPISVSGRVSDLDAEIPHQLGVSKAILENVIFCHQEDSNWPLSEPSVLKKKFDEIFCSTRYSKALDQLKVIRKEQMQQLKVENVTMEMHKSDLEKSKKLLLDRQICEEKIANCQQRVVEIDLEIENTQKRMDSCASKKNEIEKYRIDFDRLLMDRDFNLKTIQELTHSIKIMPQSDDELHKILLERSSIVKTSECELEDLKNARELIFQEFSFNQQQLSEKMARKGTLVNAFEMLQKKKIAFDAISNELCDELNVVNENATEKVKMLDKLTAALNTRFDSLKQIKMDAKNIEDSYFSRLQNLHNNKHQLQNELTVCRKRFVEIEQLLGDTKQKISNINVDEITEGLNLARSSLYNLENERQINQAEFESSNYVEKKAKLELAITETELNIDALNSQLKTMHELTGTRTKIEIYSNELKSKENEFLELLNDCKPGIIRLLGKLPSIETIGRDFEQATNSIDRNLELYNQKYNDVNYAVKLIQSKIDANKVNLYKRENEVKEIQKRIMKITKNEDFSLCLEYAEQQLKNLNDSASKSIIFLSQKFSSSCNSCPLCDRAFKDDFERGILTEKFHLASTEILKIQEKRALLENTLEELKNIRPIHDDVERFRLYEIPQLISTIDSLTIEKEQNQDILNDLSDNLCKYNEQDKLAKKLKRNIEDIVKLHSEISHLNDLLKSAESECNSVNTYQFSSSIERISELIESERDKINSCRRNIKRLDDEHFEQLKTMTEVQFKISNFKEVISQQESSLSSYNSLIKNEQNYLNEQLELAPKISLIESDLARSIENIYRVEQEKSDKLYECNQNEDVLHKQLIALQSRLNELSSIFDDLDSYSLEENIETELKAIETEIENLKTDLSLKSSDLENITGKINICSLELSEIESVERSVRENIKLRDCKRKEDDFEAMISKLQLIIDTSNLEEIMNLCMTLQIRLSDLLGMRSGLLGEIKIHQEQIMSISNELKTSYFDVEEKYERSFVKFTTLSLSCSDLEKCAKILDAAIMKYHSMKMSEINKIIRELWMNTYQCSDIDTIEIRSDIESTVANRSYNYHVVMIKGNTELDMRGRSSAGQRVLTSLIIRLALAEAFGLNCGILALDEPTTNLDKNNIESLADSLVNIIKSRRVQRNFQLVIITHDEEFVDLLGRSEYVDYYWKIRKDLNNHSIIERQSYHVQ